jgi:DNA-binding beta-propeller fold protein YncE
MIMTTRKATPSTARLAGMLRTTLLSTTLLITAAGAAQAQQRMLYTLSNEIESGRNSVIAYTRLADGKLKAHPAGPFLTKGTGIDNPTNGKLGPNDNDAPLIVSPDGRRLFAVNGNTNTVAVFDVAADGSLRHVAGSPFASEGIGPVSLSLSGDILLVANRNEDPKQLKELAGAAKSNYASFRVGKDGGLTLISKVDIADGQKTTQVLVSQRDRRIVFGNDFQVDVDFDGPGSVSRLFGNEPQVRGQLQSFRLDAAGRLSPVSKLAIPETAVGKAPEVPSIPLGIWDHPTRNLLYAGLVTRNQLGVFRYDDTGRLSFLAAVPNSGQDICWLRTNAAGTRLYAVNNLPREDAKDSGGTVTVFDISGARAEKPVEIGRVELPLPLGTFVNNRTAAQPNSAPFQFALDSEEKYLYVISQRINQLPANTNVQGNIIHTVELSASGKMKVVASQHLGPDGVTPRARPHGIALVDLPTR